ncbi:Bax inhibitor 1 [Branchiostoma belcheri]|nr:Bax inhibitor 1 [Branchiostoma belcheri]
MQERLLQSFGSCIGNCDVMTVPRCSSCGRLSLGRNEVVQRMLRTQHGLKTRMVVECRSQAAKYPDLYSEPPTPLITSMPCLNNVGCQYLHLITIMKVWTTHMLRQGSVDRSASNTSTAAIVMAPPRDVAKNATVMTSGQTGQFQYDAISESLDVRNLSYGTRPTASQLNSLYKTATVSCQWYNRNDHEPRAFGARLAPTALKVPSSSGKNPPIQNPGYGHECVDLFNTCEIRFQEYGIAGDLTTTPIVSCKYRSTLVKRPSLWSSDKY